MRLLLVLLLALAAAPVQAAPPTAEEVVSLALSDVIRPGFVHYAAATEDLESAVGTACKAPSAETLSVARAAFRSTVAAWSRIELYRFGPLMADNRIEHILFWPDRKGIALKQVQAVLADADETATTADTLEVKSVAVQGLGTLEYLLFGTDADQLATGANFRCRFALAIATVQHRTAAAMSDEWNDPAGFSQRLLNPGDADPDYRSFREVAEELTGLLAHGSEIIRDQRLLPFLGRDGAPPKPKSALFWRSGMTVPSIAQNFAGLADLLEKSRIGEAASDDGLWVGNSAAFEFGNAARAAALVTAPVDEALDVPKQRQALDYLVIVTRSLDTLLGESLAAALGLSVGFSSLDGD